MEDLPVVDLVGVFGDAAKNFPPRAEGGFDNQRDAFPVGMIE